MPILAPTETLDRFETIELLQAYYQHPPHYGSLADATLSLSGHTPGCSDQLTLYIRLSHTGQRIEQVQFEGAGCTISQAAAALLCERVTGMLVQICPRSMSLHCCQSWIAACWSAVFAARHSRSDS